MKQELGLKQKTSKNMKQLITTEEIMRTKKSQNYHRPNGFDFKKLNKTLSEKAKQTVFNAN